MNSQYHYYSLSTGLLTGDGCTGPDDIVAGNAPSNTGWIEGVTDWESQRVDVATTTLVDYTPPAPASDDQQTWAWDTTTKRWVAVPTLAAIRDVRWGVIQATRDALEAGTFVYNGWTFQINKVNMQGAALSAFFAQQAGNTTWTEAWILFDNTTITMNATQMMACGQAMQVYVSGLYSTSTTLRAQLDAATTPEQVAAVAWPT